MKIFLVVLSLVISLSFATAKKACYETISEYSKEDQAINLALPFAKFLEKELRAPTTAEFAQVLGWSISQLNDLSYKPEKLLEAIRDSYPSTFDKVQAKLAKKMVADWKATGAIPDKRELAESSGFAKKELDILLGNAADISAFIKEADPKLLQQVQNQFVAGYIRCVKRFLRPPSVTELASELHIEEATLQGQFALLFEEGTALTELKSLAFKKNPKAFNSFVDTDIFNPARRQKLMQAIEKRTRFAVVTAVAGSRVDKNFLETLLSFCKKNDAEILVYPSNMQTTGLAEELLNTPGVHILTHSIDLNPWWQLNNIKILAKQIKPLMGLERIEGRKKSIVIGAPKMHSKIIPTKDNTVFPKWIVTAPAITLENYQGERYIEGRTDEIAKHDHKMGALLFEKTMGADVLNQGTAAGTFHVRHIEYFPDEKGFTDLNFFYSGNKKIKIIPEALVLGDVHVGDTDQLLLPSLVEMIKNLKPKRIILHDLLNGHSICHHERQDTISLAAKAKAGNLNLKEEIDGVVRFVNSLLALDPKMEIVVVHSNHNYWLHKWLKDGQYLKEPVNTSIGLELANAYLNLRQDPLKYALFKGVENSNRIVFLPAGQSYKVGHKDRLVELGEHGDKGVNGAKGGLLSYQRGFDRSVTGHRHTTERLNDAITVGTITEVPLGYSKEGLGNWNQSVVIVDSLSSMQILEFQNGEWFSKDKVIDNPSTFFFKGYPKEIPNLEPTGGGEGQLSQWSSR